MVKKYTAEELRKIQKELVDNVLTNPEELERIINIQLAARKGFHNYTLRNILLASWELYTRTGETAELLAPYSKWNDIPGPNGKTLHRNVKYGEKALHVLAPYTYKIKEKNEDGEEEVVKTVLRFKSVPVFDISQTEGDPLETDFTSSNVDWTLEEITKRCNVKVNESNKEITRGYTNGKEIWVSKSLSESHKICTFFHELAHYHLHFDSDRYELKSSTKELEAEATSYLISKYLGIENGEAAAYIHAWTRDVDPDEKKKLLKGKGNNVLNTATLIIEQLKLSELLDSKTTVQQHSSVNVDEINWVGVK